MEKNVHTEHCCSIHGCKYSNAECPVKLGLQKQSYPCEWCDMDKDEYNSMNFAEFVSYLTNDNKKLLRGLLDQKPDRGPAKFYKNSLVYLQSRSASTVYYTIHCAPNSSSWMPAEQWDALPDA